MCTNFPLLSSNSDTMSLPEVDFIISLLSAKGSGLTNDLSYPVGNFLSVWQASILGRQALYKAISHKEKKLLLYKFLKEILFIDFLHFIASISDHFWVIATIYFKFQDNEHYVFTLHLSHTCKNRSEDHANEIFYKKHHRLHILVIWCYKRSFN